MCVSLLYRPKHDMNRLSNKTEYSASLDGLEILPIHPSIYFLLRSG